MGSRLESYRIVAFSDIFSFGASHKMIVFARESSHHFDDGHGLVGVCRPPHAR